MKWLQEQQFNPCRSLASRDSFGTVFPAQSQLSDLVVGVKFSRSFDPDCQAQENAILKLLLERPHDNIVLVIRKQSWPGPFWLSTQIFELPFSDLEQWLVRFAVDCSSAGFFSRDASAGLAHLHNLGVEHRDLKPANLSIHTLAGSRTQLRISNFSSAMLRPDPGSGRGGTKLRPDFGTCCSHDRRSLSVAPVLQV